MCIRNRHTYPQAKHYNSINNVTIGQIHITKLNLVSIEGTRVHHDPSSATHYDNSSVAFWWSTSGELDRLAEGRLPLGCCSSWYELVLRKNFSLRQVLRLLPSAGCPCRSRVFNLVCLLQVVWDRSFPTYWIGSPFWIVSRRLWFLFLSSRIN